MNDLRFALRQLLKNPGFSAVAVLTLAIGIGANTAVFSFVDRLLIRPLPVPEPHRLVTIAARMERGASETFHYPFYRDLRDRNTVLAGLAAYDDAPLSLTVNDQAERVQGLIVSENYFSLLGVVPALGRAFLPEEGRDGNAGALISHRCWMRRFEGDPGIIGKTVRVNGQAIAIVGVVPAEFTGTMAGLQPELYVPVSIYPRLMPGAEGNRILESRFMLWLRLIGRLQPGVSQERAQASLRMLAEHLKQENGENISSAILLEDGAQGHNREMAEARLPLALVQVTVALLLLIACANVANLFLARASARQREIAIRLSIGASRARILRQLLSECVVLSLLAGLAGWTVAIWLNRVLTTFRPPGSSGMFEVPLDARVLGFALLVSVLSGLIFGAAPAWQSARSEFLSQLKKGAGNSLAATGGWGLRHWLVVLQAALSVMILIAAGLCLRTVRKLQSVDAGFEPARMLLCSLDGVAAGYDESRGAQFYTVLLERVRALPGVEAASMARNPMLGKSSSGISVHRVDGYQPGPQEILNFGFDTVTPDHFRTMGMRMIHGREFMAGDTAAAVPVVVVNETIANRYWPGENPLGKRIYLPDMREFKGFGAADSVGAANPKEIAREIIGVVQDAKYRSLSEKPRPMMFWPMAQNYEGRMTLHVRSAVAAAALVGSIRQLVHALNPNMPVFNFRTMEQQRADSIFIERMLATMLGGFGAIGLLLAALGIYGVLAFAVSLRTQEIGVRMALGAQRADVVTMIMREGLRLTGIGLGIGVAGALGLSHLMRRLLFEVSPSDPATFVSIVLLLVAIAAFACFVPARRATKIDPMMALRYE